MNNPISMFDINSEEVYHQLLLSGGRLVDILRHRHTGDIKKWIVANEWLRPYITNISSYSGCSVCVIMDGLRLFISLDDTGWLNDHYKKLIEQE